MLHELKPNARADSACTQSASGVFDTTFGANGRVVTDLGAAEVVNAVTLASDGGFVAAGSTASGNTGSFAIVRYNADGTLFNAWGPNGNGSLLVDGGYCA